MPNVQFESLTDSLRRLPDVIKTIPDVMRNPAANPLQAAILLSIALVLVLIVLLSVIVLIMGREHEEDYEDYDEYEEYEEYEESGGAAGGAVAGAAPVAAQAAVEVAEPSSESRLMSRVMVGAIVIAVGIGVWAAAGITTASDAVCTSCHADTPHSVAVKDPHAGARCVYCHESGGSAARATIDLAGRLEHFVLAQTNNARAEEYGRPVSSDGCLHCHSSKVVGVVSDNTRGVKMSHKEPLAAGAQCVDCHVLRSGVVSRSNLGMTICLRCHDGKTAKSDCNECHLGDPGRGIVSVDATNMAQAQVPDPQCSGCHFDMSRCNACHGISMPHTALFKLWGHAHDAALDIWFNNGKTCAKCHYPGHRYCVEPGCHLIEVPGGHPNPAWATLHTLTPWGKGPLSGCSCHQWNPWDHNGMIYCQICHPSPPKGTIFGPSNPAHTTGAQSFPNGALPGVPKPKVPKKNIILKPETGRGNP